ncbi:hypothetical protein [Gemmata sp.]|uniref:hypothetical protein n=1 Tax=Gemmata sp. TaxID=1914242 RepID=UPI003F714E69
MTPLALSLLAATLISAPPDPATDQPVVVVKGDGFVVHAVGGAVVEPKLFGPLPALPPSPPQILHTALPAGRLTVLFRSGTTVGVPIPVGLNRTPHHQTRVIGAATDDERLYVLVWSAKWVVEGHGTGDVKPPESDNYAVRVYWLKDGTEVGAFPVSVAKRPKSVPRESMEAGPLEVEKTGGVTVYGETFRFKGK